MFRIAAQTSPSNREMGAQFSTPQIEVNEIGVDDFVTAEPTPKIESRRGWRRRRVRRCKS